MKLTTWTIFRNKYTYIDISNWLSQSGGMSGIFGATVGCPLYMIKTQIQAQSYGTFAVGFQHGHKGTFDALKRILSENGVKGLWRGWTGILIRTGVGSSAQLVSYLPIMTYFLVNFF